VVEHLLKQGESVEGNANADFGPLHWAVFRNRPQLLKMLIDAGADLSRPNAAGQTALGMVKGKPICLACERILTEAGAPLMAPGLKKRKLKPPKPPKPRTVKLRPAFKKLRDRMAKAVVRFSRDYNAEPVTFAALACTPHEGEVMIAFDTGKSRGNPWDFSHSEFAYVKFPDWRRGHDGDRMQLVGLDGKAREGKPDSFQQSFMDLNVAVLKSLQKDRAFEDLQRTRACRLVVLMTEWGKEKMWKLTRDGR